MRPYISSVELSAAVIWCKRAGALDRDRMRHESLAEWNGNGGSRTEAEQAGRHCMQGPGLQNQVRLGKSVQAHRVAAGKCNYRDHADICLCATRGKWTSESLRIVDAWNAKRRC